MMDHSIPPSIQAYLDKEAAEKSQNRQQLIPLLPPLPSIPTVPSLSKWLDFSSLTISLLVLLRTLFHRIDSILSYYFLPRTLPPSYPTLLHALQELSPLPPPSPPSSTSPPSLSLSPFHNRSLRYLLHPLVFALTSFSSVLTLILSSLSVHLSFTLSCTKSTAPRVELHQPSRSGEGLQNVRIGVLRMLARFQDIAEGKVGGGEIQARVVTLKFLRDRAHRFSSFALSFVDRVNRRSSSLLCASQDSINPKSVEDATSFLVSSTRWLESLINGGGKAEKGTRSKVRDAVTVLETCMWEDGGGDKGEVRQS